jgi:hypothetical protein
MPLLQLINFDKLAVSAGGSVFLNLTVTPADSAVLRAGDFVPVVEPGVRTLWLGSSSSSARPGAAATFVISGPTTPLSACGGSPPRESKQISQAPAPAHVWQKPVLNSERRGGAARWDPRGL